MAPFHVGFLQYLPNSTLTNNNWRYQIHPSDLTLDLAERFIKYICGGTDANLYYQSLLGNLT